MRAGTWVILLAVGCSADVPADAEAMDSTGDDGEVVAGSSGDDPGGDATGDREDTGGAEETGEDSGEDTAEEDDTGEAATLDVLNVQSAASHENGDSLIIEDYVAPADGILVVRGGAAGGVVQSVSFGGAPLEQLESHEEPEYWFAISADLYWIPVSEGQSGDIVWQYSDGEWSTRRRGAIAVTIAGADAVHAVTLASDGLGTNEGRSGPSTADLEITTTQDAVILSAFTSNGPGPSDLTGSAGHDLDAFPTIPIEDFHSTRVYGGHVHVGAGAHSLGYANNDNGWFDYILVLAAFTSDRS